MESKSAFATDSLKRRLNTPRKTLKELAKKVGGPVTRRGKFFISSPTSIDLLCFALQINSQTNTADWGRIESNASDLSNILRSNVGENIALSNATAMDDELLAFDKMREEVERQVSDYREFLEVKTKYNITATSLNKFPGLVHFIYVDRGRDVMLCPTLQGVEEDGGLVYGERGGGG